jgi:hypothetical protein
MTRLFGKAWTRKELEKHVGRISQIGGATAVTLDDGPERGVRAIDVRTGTGFRFTVLPDRGMDIGTAEYRGASLCWISPTGPVAPAFFEPKGYGWLRGFHGGMLVTCGLTYAGHPNVDQGKELGLHGRASYLPAYEVGIREGWEGDEYRIEIRGKIREAAVFGEHVVLTRTLRTALGESRLTLEDEVENLGHEETPHVLIYHINAGFPLVDDSAELLAASKEAKPLNHNDPNWSKFQKPTAAFEERCYFHTLRAGRVALVNRRLGLGYALRYPVEQLPCFCEWKQMGEGVYVVGTEPGNSFPEPRESQRRAGRLPTLQPGEKRRYQLEYSLLTSLEEIQRFENELKS